MNDIKEVESMISMLKLELSSVKQLQADLAKHSKLINWQILFFTNRLIELLEKSYVDGD